MACPTRSWRPDDGPFVGGSIPFETLRQICQEAYAGFDHPAIVPLVQLETHLFAQELFHGPTLAFKDMALQMLGLLFEHVLAERDGRVTIVGATSGDTGSAAIEACAGAIGSTSSFCIRMSAPAWCSAAR